jgi:hypothetical protein
MNDEVDKLFKSLDDYYPGSKRKRRKPDPNVKPRKEKQGCYHHQRHQHKANDNAAHCLPHLRHWLNVGRDGRVRLNLANRAV